MTFAASDRCSQVAERLAHEGYAIVPDFMPQADVQAMADELQRLKANDAFHRAGIGQGRSHVLKDEVRGDHVYWIEEASTGAWTGYYKQLEALRQAVNRHLMLGLFEFEGHYAAYPAGAFYRRHLDQFQQDSRRTLTCILYLNQGWRAEDGGQLRMYLDDQDPERILDVMPAGGTLVTFLSSHFWHEVLPARRERLSLTGWFKTRG